MNGVVVFMAFGHPNYPHALPVTILCDSPHTALLLEPMYRDLGYREIRISLPQLVETYDTALALVNDYAALPL